MIPKSRRRSRIKRLVRRLDWIQINFWDVCGQHPAMSEARALRWAIDVLLLVDWSDSRFRDTLND